jgi:hypothetical protein
VPERLAHSKSATHFVRLRLGAGVAGPTRIDFSYKLANKFTLVGAGSGRPAGRPRRRARPSAGSVAVRSGPLPVHSSRRDLEIISNHRVRRESPASAVAAGRLNLTIACCGRAREPAAIRTLADNDAQSRIPLSAPRFGRTALTHSHTIHTLVSPFASSNRRTKPTGGGPPKRFGVDTSSWDQALAYCCCERRRQRSQSHPSQRR